MIGSEGMAAAIPLFRARQLVLFLFLGLCLICPGAGALAHASLISSDPVDGAIERVPPVQMTLRFNEPVSPLVTRLIDSAGEARALAPARALGESVEIDLPAGLPAGTHVLSYRVISADGHPVGGVVAFSVGMKSGAVVPAAVGGRWRAEAVWLTRWLVYLSLFAGVGGVFFGFWIAPETGNDATRRFPRWLIVGGMPIAIAAVGLQGLDALDLPVPALATAGVWAAGFNGSFGLATILLIGAQAAALLALGAWGKAGRILSLLALFGVGAGLATTGHASAASPQWLTRPAVFVHAIGAAIWVGALAPLVAMAARDAPELGLVLRRFSRLALWTVPALIAAGCALALIQVGGLAPLAETPYGLILSAKLVAVLFLLVLAALNLLILSPGVARGEPAARLGIFRSVAAELGLAAIILMLVAGWRLTPPPRALAARPAAVAEPLHMHGEAMMATLTFSPGRTGRNSVHIDVLAGDFSPLAPKELSLILRPADESIEARTVAAIAREPGAFDADEVFIPFSGRWTIEVSALIDDFSKTRLSGEREFAN